MPKYYIKKWCGIYKVTNKKTGKVYVGQSVDIMKRWVAHSNIAVKKLSLLQQDIKGLGIEWFTFEVIELCDKTLLNVREKHWIKELDTMTPTGYNLTAGGGRKIKDKNKRLA